MLTSQTRRFPSLASEISSPGLPGAEARSTTSFVCPVSSTSQLGCTAQATHIPAYGEDLVSWSPVSIAITLDSTTEMTDMLKSVPETACRPQRNA